MKRKVFRPLEKRVKEIEEGWNSLEDFVIFSTFGMERHTMKIEGKSLFDEKLFKVYEELSDLERADLFDYQKRIEGNGKFC